MVVVRDVFRLKFGQSKDATAHWKKAAEGLKESGYGVVGVRLLTDFIGAPYYTIVFETTYKSLGDFEKAHIAARDNAKFREVYAKIIPLTESGHREVFSVIE